MSINHDCYAFIVFIIQEFHIIILIELTKFLYLFSFLYFIHIYTLLLKL